MPRSPTDCKIDFSYYLKGNRGASQRHQTLEAVIDWSYDLLTKPERQLFSHLSIFVGGWTLDAAEAVGAGQNISANLVWDLLSRLVDRSLVLARPMGDGAIRYFMLESLRQYGLQHIQKSNVFAEIQQRHATFFQALAERAEPQLTGADQVAWFETLEAEHDNIRAALTWCLQNDSEAGLRLAVRMVGLLAGTRLPF